MAFPKISEIRDLSTETIQERIGEVKRALFELRFQKATRQLEQTHQFKHLRHQLAQLMTVERERQLLEAAQGQPAANESSQDDE